MKWIHTNIVPAATLFASSTQRGYSTPMLQDKAVATKLKFQGHDDEYVIIDAGAAVPVSGVAIFGHNFTGAADITLEANDTDSWLAPAFSLTLTVATAMAQCFPAEAYRFWRLHVEDPTNAAEAELGALYLGTTTEVAYVNPEMELPVETVSVSEISRSGQAYGHRQYAARAPAFTLGGISASKRDELLAVFAGHATVEPLVLVLWDGTPDVYPPLYGVFTMATMPFTKLAQAGLVFSSSFSMREVF